MAAREPPGARAVREALRALADPARAAGMRRYFRTGPGEYGEGDVFLGVGVPRMRKLAREHRDLPFDALSTLLESGVHEDRFVALVVLTERAKRADPAQRDRIARFYLRKLDRVNAWDLVDLSAPAILGPHFAARSRARLRALARSRSVWRRRVAVLTTLHFIREGDHEETFAMARALLEDEHDLIHKAVGWMLREAGNRDSGALRAFLDGHAARMPRTMLRYAIEKLPAGERAAYLAARAAPAAPPEEAPWSIRPDGKAVAAHLATLPPPVRAVAAALDGIVRSELPDARVGVKWRVPFYYLRGPVCYLSGARRHVTFGLLFGTRIRDGSGRLTGTGKSPIRKATLPAGEPVPEAAVRAWLRQARRLDADWGKDMEPPPPARAATGKARAGGAARVGNAP